MVRREPIHANGMIREFDTTMRYASICLAVALLATASATPVRGGLKVGDVAPSFAPADWVKGEAVSFPRDLGKHIYLVEFWATWCGPCKMSIPLLTELQHQYAADLKIVSFTAPDPNNSLATVRRFVERQGAQMDYAIAFDSTGKTHGAYMQAAGAMGIPYAFLVGRDGKIAWQGSPLDPELTFVLKRMVAGTFNAKVHAQVKAKIDMLSLPHQMRDWPKVIEGLQEILRLDPLNGVVLGEMVRVHVEELKDKDRLRAVLAVHVKDVGDNPQALAIVAEVLFQIPELSDRMPDLVLEVAQEAYELSAQGPRADISSTYARALYQVGALDRAIEIQREALSLASRADRDKARKVLDYYLECRKVRNALTD